jgi:S-adenosylmethionine:tRNA ribosyltransferase-isomerase
MRTEEFDYPLPESQIAQAPVEPRDASRLLLLGRRTGAIAHHAFGDLPALLAPGDLLVLNDTRVLPARLIGVKPTGGRAEALLLRDLGGDRWEAMVFPGRRLDVGARISFGARSELDAEVVGRDPSGTRVLQFLSEASEDVPALIHRLGEVPLPPYIHAPLADRERYQTVYARLEGSAAAPTAGLHFTAETFARLAERGVAIARVTLHVGIATFRPVKAETIEQHEMHEEWFEVPDATAAAIARAPGRVVALGTTTVRALESAAEGWRRVRAGVGRTRLYITPGYEFRVVDALVTNFHMPRSSLLILVAAFAGLDRVKAAYYEALAAGYRFLSFGDAMLIL